MCDSPGIVILILLKDPFIESPDNKRAWKAVVVYFQYRGLKVSADNMTNLSVDKKKWICILA